MADTPAGTRPRRLYLIIPLVLVATIFVAYTVLWFFGRGVMDEEVAAFITDEREAGREVRYEELAIKGYPLSLRAQIEDFAWAEPGVWRWTGDMLHIVTLPHDPSRLIFAPKGAQRLTYGRTDYDFTAADLRVGIEADKYAAQTAEFVATGDGQRLEIGSLRANFVEQEREDARWILGTSTRGIVFTDRDGRAAHLPFLNIAASQAPGQVMDLTLDAVQFAVSDAAGATPTVIEVRGPVGVDGFGYPTGRLTISIRNEKTLLDVLTEWGLLTEADRRTAQQTLGAFTRNGTELAQLPLPLVMRDGKAFIGPQEVADLPKLF